MKKTALGIFLGMLSVISLGMTYEITYGVTRENVVDVRIVEVGGHEYVIASSFTPKSNHVNNSAVGGRDGRNDVWVNNVSRTVVSSAASSLCMMHHAGCKACCAQK